MIQINENTKCEKTYNIETEYYRFYVIYQNDLFYSGRVSQREQYNNIWFPDTNHYYNMVIHIDDFNMFNDLFPHIIAEINKLQNKEKK